MAFCANCGSEISDMAVACPSCGHSTGRGTAGARRTEGTAVAAFVVGLVGIFLCPIIGGIVAIILGSQAKNRIAADPSLEGEGMAKAGIILGWVGIALGVIGLLVWGAMFGSMMRGFDQFDSGF